MAGDERGGGIAERRVWRISLPSAPPHPSPTTRFSTTDASSPPASNLCVSWKPVAGTASPSPTGLCLYPRRCTGPSSGSFSADGLPCPSHHRLPPAPSSASSGGGWACPPPVPTSALHSGSCGLGARRHQCLQARLRHQTPNSIHQAAMDNSHPCAVVPGHSLGVLDSPLLRPPSLTARRQPPGCYSLWCPPPHSPPPLPHHVRAAVHAAIRAIICATTCPLAAARAIRAREREGKRGMIGGSHHYFKENAGWFATRTPRRTKPL